MKKLFCLLLIITTLVSTASAIDIETAVGEYNSWARSYFMIPEISQLKDGTYYSVDKMMIAFHADADGNVDGAVCTDIGKAGFEAFINAAVCTIFSVESTGENIDVFGKVMSAYFRTRNREDGLMFHSFLESGARIDIMRQDGIYTLYYTK